MERWCSIWRIKLNTKKTQFILFGKGRKKLKKALTLFGTQIALNDQVILLGITYDKKMNLSAQINKIITKAKQKTGLLRRLRRTGWGTSSQVLIKLYVCFIRPILEYGAVLTAGVQP